MKFNNLQALRGISALLVCCFHMRHLLNTGNREWGEILFQNGSIGVPIFFVISGFIMVYTTQRFSNTAPATALREFLIKRIIRIVPLYYLLTICWMIIGGTPSAYLTPEGLSRAISSFLFLPAEQEPVLFVGWSLNYEMFFYFIFAISFLFKGHRYKFILAFFITAIVVGRFYHSSNPILQMVLSFLNLHFILGILLGLNLEKFKSLPKRSLWILSTIGIVFFSLFYFNQLKISEPFFSAIIVGGFVLSFLLFDRFLNVRANRFLVFLGDISFSVYLIHPFVGIVLRRFESQDDFHNFLLFLANVILTVIISKISYEIIEKRVTEYLKSKLIRP